MKKIAWMLILTWGCLFAARAECAWTGNVNFEYLGKVLHDEEWEPVDEQTGQGVQADIKPESWFLGLSAGYQTLDDSAVDKVSQPVEGKTSEADLGIKFITDNTPSFHLFLAGGVCRIDAELGTPLGRDTDSGEGWWGSVGFYWTLFGHVNLGVSAKRSKADVTLLGADKDAGGSTFGGFLGFHF